MLKILNVRRISFWKRVTTIKWREKSVENVRYEEKIKQIEEITIEEIEMKEKIFIFNLKWWSVYKEEWQ